MADWTGHTSKICCKRFLFIWERPTMGLSYYNSEGRGPQWGTSDWLDRPGSEDKVLCARFLPWGALHCSACAEGLRRSFTAQRLGHRNSEKLITNPRFINPQEPPTTSVSTNRAQSCSNWHIAQQAALPKTIQKSRSDDCCMCNYRNAHHRFTLFFFPNRDVFLLKIQSFHGLTWICSWCIHWWKTELGQLYFWVWCAFQTC